MCSLSKQNASFVAAGTFSRLSTICSELLIFIKTQQEYKCAQGTNIDASLFEMFLLAVLVCLPGSISKLAICFLLCLLLWEISTYYSSLNPEPQN